jgi:tetratricopeptide (TPR) repeat protein
MRRNFPNRALLIPARRDSLSVLLSLGFNPDNTVIWLDDLQDYLGSDGLTENVLDSLTTSGRARTTILATMRATAHDQYSPKGDVQASEWKVLGRAEVVRLGRKLTDAERARARTQFSDVRLNAAIERFGLAEYLAAGPDLVNRLENGTTVNPVGTAIVRAGVDWRRMGLTRPTPLEVIRELYPAYLEDEDAESLRTDRFDEGLAWAQERIYATSALLSSAANGFVAFDYVLDYIEKDLGHPIPDHAWDLGLHATEDPNEAFALGVFAYAKSSLDIAERAFLKVLELDPDSALRANAAFNLGVLLTKRDASEEAESWFRQAAEGGVDDAAYNLGALLAKRRAAPEAEKWLKKAAQSKNSKVAFAARKSLGLLWPQEVKNVSELLSRKVEEDMQLRLQIRFEGEIDETKLADLRLQLRQEISEVADSDASLIERPLEPTAESPVVGDKVRGGGIANLIVMAATSPALLGAVTSAIQSWLGKGGTRSVKLELDGDMLEVTGLSSKDQQRLVEEWIRRNTTS